MWTLYFEGNDKGDADGRWMIVGILNEVDGYALAIERGNDGALLPIPESLYQEIEGCSKSFLDIKGNVARLEMEKVA